MNSNLARNKLVIGALGLVIVLIIGAAAFTFLGKTSSTKPGSAASTPVTDVAEAAGQYTNTPEARATSTPLAVDTPVPATNTPQPPPTDTPPPPPTNTTAPPPTNTSLPPSPATAQAKANQQPAPAKAKSDPNILPNGVRYGDHTPKLPDRIVRIASPNIKLDCKVYEVYAVNGAWEVADYAAGHNYNSANPGEGGNIVLAGHNNWRGEVFRYLEFLKQGDEIDVWTLNGKEYKYQVQSIVKLKEAGASLAERISHGHVMDPTPYEQLTLITCWPYTTYTHRLVVTAKPMQ